jgi:hypothetical protein
MSVKGQLRACTDFLMVGMKAAERANSEYGQQLMRACMDHVELLVRQSENVKAPEVDATIALLTKAAAELQADEASATAIISALRNAIGRLQALRTELAPPANSAPTR